VSVPSTMGFLHGAPRRGRSAMAIARRSAKAIARRSAKAIARRSAKASRRSTPAAAADNTGRSAAAIRWLPQHAVAALQKGGTASTAVAVASSSGAASSAAPFAIPSAVAVDGSSRCGARPKHMARRAEAVPASSGRKRVRFVPPLELFIIAGEFPGDQHRLPWNAMFVSIGDLFTYRTIASRNDKGDFFVAGASCLGWVHGPQVGARASAVAELSKTGWLGSGALVGAPRYSPKIWRRIAPDESCTVGLAVDIVFAEKAAVAEFGASGASVVVVATSSCRLGDNTAHICQFISDVGADLVVMIDNGPRAGVTRSSAPAIDSCAQELSDWVVGCGMAADLEVLYADDILAVARMKHIGCRRFLFGLHRQQQFEHRGNARNIKLCGG
jgi:hypothetical protein